MKRFPPEPILAEALAYVFLAALALCVIVHDSRPLTDPMSPDFAVAEVGR